MYKGYGLWRQAELNVHGSWVRSCRYLLFCSVGIIKEFRINMGRCNPITLWQKDAKYLD